MSEPTVAEIFPEGHEPFLAISGALSPKTGDPDFFPYSTHRDLESRAEAGFTKPVTFRFVIGRIGEGKTWTLSWLWRRFKDPKSGQPPCLVLGIRRLQHGPSLERSLVEQLLVALSDSASDVVESASKVAKASRGLKTLAAYWADEGGRYVLLGQGASSRAPRLSGFPPINMGRQSDLSMIMMAVLEAARIKGYERVLILIDELEGPVERASATKIGLLADFLRDLQDALQNPAVPCAHVQFLLSGTGNVAEQFDPQLQVERTYDAMGVVGAFVRRAEPPFRLQPPTEGDLEELANYRIKLHRDKKYPGQPPKPFKMDAILAAWKYSKQTLGQFAMILEKMYELAVEADDSVIDTSHFEKAKKAGY